MLQFIRRTLGIAPVSQGKKEKEPKAFNQCADAIQNKLKAPFDPENWTSKKHDLALLRILSAKGFDSTTIDALKEDQAFSDIKFETEGEDVDFNKLIYDRITELCNLCRDEHIGKGGMAAAQRRPIKITPTPNDIIPLSGPAN